MAHSRFNTTNHKDLSKSNRTWGSLASVAYTNLSPGTYTFSVTAANSDGVWNKEGDRIVIVIDPRFWETSLFKIGVLLLTAVLLFFVVKYYLGKKLQTQQEEFNRLHEIEKVRSKISMDIHDELSSGLTKISLLSQRVNAKFRGSIEVDPSLLDKISVTSREVINSLGEIIAGKSRHLVKGVSYFGNTLLNASVRV